MKKPKKKELELVSEEDVKKAIPQMITIFLSRKEGRYCDEKNEFCDWQVHDLKEAEKIISKL